MCPKVTFRERGALADAGRHRRGRARGPVSWRALDALAQAALDRRRAAPSRARSAPLAAETLAWPFPNGRHLSGHPGPPRHAPSPMLASGDPYRIRRRRQCWRASCRRPKSAAFPQPSAFALATARLGWARQDCVTALSLCGRPVETLVPALRDGARILALSADAVDAGPGRRALLCRRGFGASTVVTVLEAMGGPRERDPLRPDAEGFGLDGIDALNTLGDRRRGGRRDALLLAPGRPDALFDHDGQITRGGCPRRDAGAAGSPGAARCCGMWGRARARWRSSGCWRIRRTAPTRSSAIPERARPDRAQCRGAGRARTSPRWRARRPGALAGLPAPDAVFVGGGATGEGVLDACAAALKRRAGGWWSTP